MPVICPRCSIEVAVAVEEMVQHTYRMTADGQVSLVSVPEPLMTHLREDCQA